VRPSWARTLLAASATGRRFGQQALRLTSAVSAASLHQTDNKVTTPNRAAAAASNAKAALWLIAAIRAHC
jgi:hypothetical protein